MQLVSRGTSFPGRIFQLQNSRTVCKEDIVVPKGEVRQSPVKNAFELDIPISIAEFTNKVV